MIPVAVQKDRGLWERAFNLAPRVFSLSKMSAAILKKEKTLGLGWPANGRRISGRRFSPASFSTGNTSAVRSNRRQGLGWVSPKIPSSFPELRSFWSASWIHDRPKGSKLWVRECKNPNFPELTRVTLLADSLLQSHF